MSLDPPVTGGRSLSPRGLPIDLFNIGNFSRMSGLPVKTLRFYHEKQLLIPARVDGDTGYRHYDKRNLEKAHVIVALRKLSFGLDTIAEIFARQEDDADILDFLEQHKQRLQGEIQIRDDIVHVLNSIIAHEKDARKIMGHEGNTIEEKTIPSVLVGGIRTKGRYADCAKLFSQLGRKLGMNIKGKAMMLCYDDEYREDDADFEPCMPLKKSVDVSGIDVRELPGGRCISLVHRGSYEELTRSYSRLLEHVQAEGIAITRPTREVYLKGPGMIFKGNPKKYLTEIQFMLDR